MKSGLGRVAPPAARRGAAVRGHGATRAGGERAGVALVYAVFGTFVVASMVAVMFTLAGASGARADVQRGAARARLLAEGALSVVEKDLRASLANWEDPVLEGTKTIAGTDVRFLIRELGVRQTSVDSSGVASIVQPFEIQTTSAEDGAQRTARTIVNVEWMPLFQFAVFYGTDLEIHAGPDLTLRGRVHSNGDMYLGGGSTITLDTNYVRAVGDIYRMNKHGGAAAGSVDIRRYVDDPFDSGAPSEFERMLSQDQFGATSTTSGYDSNFTAGYDADGDGLFNGPGDWLPFEFGAAELWGPPSGSSGTGQTVMTGQHGVTEAVTPDVGSIQMYEETASGTGGDYRFDEESGTYIEDPGNGTHDRGYFYDNAGLAVIVDGNGQLRVTDAAGNDVTVDVAGAITVDEVADMRQSDSGSEGTPVARIDLELLAATGHFPANGLVYASHELLGEGTDAGGLMLTGGAELAQSLTVASSGPVYVQGDYNVTDKKSAAVIGDAVNLLSNAWDGTKAPGTLPDATETTYNFAMITGSYSSESGRYNGGLENLPRFHEDWAGVACNIAGSFVNIFDSEHATGDWAYGGDRYTAPVRDWQYDPLFNDVESLPPFTPMAVTATGVVSW
ncbi:MAG: hypothetical protein AAFP22_01310 [Planctomycetota bacterium]